LLVFTSFYFLVLNFLEVLGTLLPLPNDMLMFWTLSLCFYIFLIGAFGIIFNRKNIIMLMVSVEVMFLGINLVFIFSFFINGAAIALIYALIILSLAAAEAAIGFGLLVVSFRNKPNIEFKAFNRLKG